MKLGEVFRYEIAHRVRTPSTWLYAAVLFGIGFMVMHGQSELVQPVHANAPERLATYAATIAIFGMLITAALFGDAALRDIEAGMDPLVYTAPVAKADYLGGRFLAALTVNAVVLLAVPLGLASGTLMPYLEGAAFGPFRAAAYLQPWLLFLLPNLCLAGSVLFAVGVLTRQVIPVYLAAIGLMVTFMVARASLSQYENPALVLLGDPLGMRALNDLREYWTAAERNSRLVGFPAGLLVNRAVWLAVAIATLGLLHRRFRFTHPDAGSVRWYRKQRLTAAPASTTTEPERPAPVAVPRVAGTFGLRTAARQTLAVAAETLAELAGSRWYGAVLLGCLALALLFSWDVGASVFDTSTWPVTLVVTETFMNTPLVPLSFMLIALYAGELVWKAREVGVAEITDAAPVPDAALLLGRFVALVLMLAVIQAAIMTGGILSQIANGYYRLELGLYVRILLGLNFANIVLLAALAMTIHVVMNHKYLGHITVLIACVFPIAAQEIGLLRHHLLLYGTDPGWTYSDMNGFGRFIGPFVWFKLYWAAWALLLTVAAILLWVRGHEHGVRRRLLLARLRIDGPTVRVAGAAAALIAGSGGFIFYNTNILNAYRPPDAVAARQAEYEKRYSRFALLPQPTITRVELRVEIYPDDPAVDIRGTYHMVNRTDEAIDAVHVASMTPEVQLRSITFDRAATPVLEDGEVAYRTFSLERTLGPGEPLEVTFDLAFRPQGFPNHDIQTEVVGNGARFNRRWLPFIGYQRSLELSDNVARERYGLGPRPLIPGPDDVGATHSRELWRDADRVDIDMIIGTAADQIAITPGVLRRSWTEPAPAGSQKDRRYFHYATASPVPFGATVFSGQYAVREDRWQHVALRLYHHPAHTYNLDTTVRSMKASLAYFTSQFGPYPDSELRVVEYPRYGGFGVAHPHTVAFTEDYFFSRVKEGEIDQPFYGTAHEVAHQWWGGMVRGAAVRGHGFLSESLANYSAMMVNEKTYGLASARRVYEFQMQRYLTGRARVGREVPLLEVEDQPYIAYRKGAVAMYTLRERIGEARVNAALRRYVEKYRGAGPPYPTSLDLYAELRAVTPEPLQYLLVDLFETATLWEVKTERAVAKPTGTGEYEVVLDVFARKMRADRDGNESDVPMDEPVEIGVFAPGDDDLAGKPLYLGQQRIRSGAQTIRVTVPRAPGRAGIDPWRKLIDRKRDDNVVVVEAGG